MEKIVLAGFMGAGKTTVGKALSKILGVEFIDTDALIEKRFGSIEQIFAEKGEQFFRKVEAEIISEVLDGETPRIVAIGGGALTLEKTLKIVLEKSIPIYLKCPLGVCYERVKDTNRPLAKNFRMFEQLFLERKKVYESLPFFVNTDSAAPEEIAHLIKNALSGKTFSAYGHITVKAEQAVETAKKLSNVVITDENVFSIYKNLFSSTNNIVIKAGEQSKTLNTVRAIYQRFLDIGVSRHDTISYAGGGVVGDIAGFAAATFMRGVPLRAFPTTLLSMSDSAIGGKNGVNLSGVKNVVGTFYIPKETIINPIFLNTLPEKEILSGSGEIFKYAVLSENGIFEQLERIYTEEHGSHGSYAVKNVLFLNVLKSAILEKLRWLEGDLTDKKGKRAFLNLGHTIGHLAEKLTNFSISHGEGVAFGIVTSAFYALKNNLLSKKDFHRICTLYSQMGFDFTTVSAQLKAALQDPANGNALKVLRADKKRSGDEILWILPVKYNQCTMQKTPVKNIQKTLTEVINEDPCN